MDSRGEKAQAVGVKRPTLTPKTIIYQKFGTRACYSIEEVQASAVNVCPGLALPQHGRCLYRCRLDLPDLSVVSDTLPRKKDAERSAAKKAMEKLGIQIIQSTLGDPTPQEIWSQLVQRVSQLFTDEFLLSSHPLIGHFREAFERKGDNYGCIPLSAILSCDSKTRNLCRSINPIAESDPLLMAFLIMKAAESVLTYPDGLWIRKKNAYSQDLIESVIDQHPKSAETMWLEAVLIPSSAEKPTETLIMDIAPSHYYLDEIASKLNVQDSSRLLISRPIGKVSNEMRLYFPVPESSFSSLDSLPDILSNAKGNTDVMQNFNERASYLSGQNIYGNAILAIVGYTWRSSGLFHGHVSLSTYYRMIVSKIPVGNYKLCREAILVAEFPTIYTSSNWRGPSPKDLIHMFCRDHRLPEPLFNLHELLEGRSIETSKSFMLLKQSKKEEEILSENGDVCRELERDTNVVSHYSCELKILSRQHDLIIQYFHGDIYKKKTDAIQNAAFQVLSLLNLYFKQLDMPMDTLATIGRSHGIIVSTGTFLKEFGMCLSIHGANENNLYRCSSVGSISANQSDREHENEISMFNTDFGDSCVCPSHGSFACISYMVTLLKKDMSLQEILESKSEFEFEIGTGAVIHQLEAHVMQMSINQTVKFNLEIPSRDLILSAASETAKYLSKLPLSSCILECSVTLLWIQEPLEDRIEQAFFIPPLSKQRVEFAVRFINESQGKTLVDFGCGSGSLFDSLLECTTTLEKIVGVDISHKSLTRAAKRLHSKLSSCVASREGACIRSVVLYDGSITVFDSRLYRFDVSTCLEVIEHMEEDQANLFGEIVLSLFCPQLLIVSTPNYEYNPILQRSSLSNKEEHTEEKSEAAPCKFRNYDHKFEWTRKQFECWATNLASSHGYSVEFGGVGGLGDTEPGFASQIAVFRRKPCSQEDESGKVAEHSHPYEVIWEWEEPASDA